MTETRVYETLIIVKWRGKHIPANRKVEIGDEHWPIWDQLVVDRSARLVPEEELLQEALTIEPPEEPEPKEKANEPAPEEGKSASKSRSKKSS
jgi:hypothetical protein